MNNRKRAFETFVQEHKATVYSVCYMFSDNQTDADDLFQEVLINLWRGYGTFRGDSSARTWVYRVSMNTCISFDRKKKNRSAIPTDIDPSLFVEETEAGAQTVMLHRRIQQLDLADRAVVLLWLEDMSYDEIGAVIGISAKAVGVRLVRIREKLKRMNNDR